MRRIGDSMTKSEAERLGGFLASRGIECEIREDGDVTLWVLDEDRLDEAESIHHDFRRDPKSAAFDAKPLAAPAPTAAKPDRARVVDVRSEVFGAGAIQGIPATMTLILLSLVATLLIHTDATKHLGNYLFISEQYEERFAEVLSGQVWRMFTPIFMHGGVLHFIFNMMWLNQLGGAVERTEGSRFFLALTLVTAALINTAEYFVSGPAFLGMSGVVYMLFGYVWMMSRYQPGTRYSIPQQTVTIMMLWLVVCLVGLIPNVANTQHVGGLICGVTFGFLRSGHLATLKRRRRFRG